MKEEEGRNLERGSDGGIGQLIAQQSQHLLTPGNQSETPVYLHTWVCMPLYQPPSITYHPSPDLELPLPLGTHSILSLEKRATIFPTRRRRCTHNSWASPLIFQQPPVTCDEDAITLSTFSCHRFVIHTLAPCDVPTSIPYTPPPACNTSWAWMLMAHTADFTMYPNTAHVLDINGWLPTPSQCLGLVAASSSFYLLMSILSTLIT